MPFDRYPESGFAGEVHEFTDPRSAGISIGNIGATVGTPAPMAVFHFGGQKDSFFGDLHAQGEDMISF